MRFRLRLLAFDYDLKHVSGKTFYVPDTLSRVEGLNVNDVEISACEVLEEEVTNVKENLPVTDVLHREIEKKRRGLIRL